MTQQDGPRWWTVPVDQRTAWESAVVDVPHGVAHTWGYNATMAAATGDATYLFVAEGEGGRLVCPFAERGARSDRDLYTPLGFGGIVGKGSVSGFRACWSELVGQHGYVAGYVMLHPVLSPAALAEGGDASSANDVYLLDLSDGIESLQDRMSASTRRRLRRWPDVGIGITTDRGSATDAFVRIYPRFMQARSAGSAYDLDATVLRGLCELPTMRLYGAPAAAPRAVIMVGTASGGADYVFGVAESDARDHISRLLWQAVADLVADGAEWLNLGGGIRPDDSLAEFKRRLGGRRVPLVSLRQVYDRARYDELCAAHGCDPETAYFPAYRAPSVRVARP